MPVRLAIGFLEHSGLSAGESKYVFGQSGENDDFDRIATPLRNLYPNGSEKSGRGGGLNPHKSWPRRGKWASIAEDEQRGQDQELEVYPAWNDDEW